MSENRRPTFTSDSERVAAARGSLTQLRALLAAVEAGEVDATLVEHAAMEGAVTALDQFVGDLE